MSVNTESLPAAVASPQPCEVSTDDILTLDEWTTSGLHSKMPLWGNKAVRNAICAERKAERERCAKIADGVLADTNSVEWNPDYADAARIIAAKIRGGE